MFGVFSKIWKNPVSHDLKIDSICVIKDWTLLTTIKDQLQGVPKNHGNSVTNWISSLLWISIVIPNFKSHNTIMSARVYFMERVKDCKDVSIMSLQDEQWRRTSLLCLYTAIFLFFKVQRMQSKHQQTKSEHSRQITAFLVGITLLNQRII